MTQTDDFGAELADFVRRVGELKAARALPRDEHLAVLDAALFELRHVADTLWPRYERLKAAAPNAPSPDRQERQERHLLKALFQRLPMPVVLVDKDTVVRRMNFAATGLTGVRAGYATGRPLSALLSPGDRGALRSQAAAVARGEGDRSLPVHLQQRPDERLLATLTALRPPDEPHPAVLVVLQTGVSAGAAPSGGRPRSAGAVAVGRRRPALPDLVETTGHAERLDLVDAMTTALLSVAPGDPEAALERAARVLHERFADWVVADTVAGRPMKRSLVLGPGGPGDEALVQALAGQDPADCALVMEAARGGSASLQVRPEDTDAFGQDPAGDPVLVRADVTSLLCVPLTAPGDNGAPGPVQGVLTLFRTGARRAFSMAEGQVMDLMSRHAALAMRRPASPRRADGYSSG
ncbi:PAS domain protein [Streptomyces agglomeratus]|uniref:PAS domain-containing protein n=1 Tax=Streptomyces agglomeratus TaxID=285458 RepID=UPI000854DA62|nr:PAS domain-containing protein [Streptomyces agglomeratus]OEJ41788.1 PAS domain protein [Streptomyces agglomeratus]OEJ43835.1 PAS domain protein [Streptomyces agglomeratus]OEJ61648.1 PAS domain protein [Streptomyces agglomeratus]